MVCCRWGWCMGSEVWGGEVGSCGWGWEAGLWGLGCGAQTRRRAWSPRSRVEGSAHRETQLLAHPMSTHRSCTHQGAGGRTVSGAGVGGG